MQNDGGDAELSFGGWLQRRRKALDLTQAELAQKVGCAVVTIKKIEQDERRPSHQLAGLLAACLGVPDAGRADFLRMARGGMLSATPEEGDSLRLPPTLRRAALPATPSAPASPGFVERAAELDRLSAYLERALAGSGTPVIILGDAGSGKTTLMAEFARRAAAAHPRLLVAQGQGNAQAGAGDPFRPFRDMLAMLTGDLAAATAASSLPPELALRLWQSVPAVLHAVTAQAPDLVDLLIPAAPLARRLTPYLRASAAWLDDFLALAQRDPSTRALLEPYQVLEETSRLLQALAADHPLLLLLDDLQWIDDFSKNLLYHLARRLSGSRILLVCACRPEEVSSAGEGRLRNPSRDFSRQGFSSDPHPITALILELTRQYGDIQLDLNDAGPRQGRAFVDALIDREPNRLGEAFRAALFQHTQGQPLFSVELLHSMRANGRLVQDSAGFWVENDAAPAQPLPARIEAVIEQRLRALSPPLQELLSVASVEGEVFTAEVAAAILGLDPRAALRQLTRELEQRHRLVTSQGEILLAAGRLNRFQFRHALYQEYLLARLAPLEVRRLHREVAASLAGALFPLDPGADNGAERLTQFGPALVQHCELGEDWQQAAAFADALGRQARQRYAMREAIAWFERALRALDRLPAAPYPAVYETLLGWEEAAYRFKPYQEQLQQLARAETLVRARQDPPRLVQVLHWTANVFLSRGLWTRAGPALTECLGLAEQLQDEQLSVRPIYFKALMMTFADPFGAAPWVDRALELARKYQDAHIEAIALSTRGQLLAELGDFPASHAAIQAARQVSGWLGSPLTELDVDLLAAWAYLAMGDLAGALEYSRRSVERAIATDNMDCICNGLACLGYGNLELGRIAEAAAAFEQGIARSDISGAIIPRLNSQAGLAVAQFYTGRPTAVSELESVIADMVRYENLVGAANANLMLAGCLAQLGAFDRAGQVLQRAADFYSQRQMRPFLMRAQMLQAELKEKSAHGSV